MDDIVGAAGLLCSMDALDQVHAKHPSSRQPEPVKPLEKVMVGASEQIGKTTVPFETRPQQQDIQLARFEELTPQRTTLEPRGVDLILDVPLGVTVELGRKRLSVKEILDLVPGSLVELDKLAGENVDLYVNGKLFAKGEVVVIDENFGVRVSSIVTPKERLERLR
jgi:flagellar motor switch protein FliN/FliY